MISFFISSGWAFRARQKDERTFAGEKEWVQHHLSQASALEIGFFSHLPMVVEAVGRPHRLSDALN